MYCMINVLKMYVTYTQNSLYIFVKEPFLSAKSQSSHTHTPVTLKATAFSGKLNVKHQRDHTRDGFSSSTVQSHLDSFSTSKGQLFHFREIAFQYFRETAFPLP